MNICFCCKIATERLTKRLCDACYDQFSYQQFLGWFSLMGVSPIPKCFTHSVTEFTKHGACPHKFARENSRERSLHGIPPPTLSCQII